MGCWNQTCSLTNLPITYGDSIVLIPLVENNDFFIPGLTYDTNSNYEIFGMPFFGHYNDYGGIENISTHITNIDFLKETKIYSRVEYNYYDYDEEDDVGLKVNNDNIEEFLNHHMIEEDLYILNNDEKEKNLNYMMIHSELYNRLINEVGELIPYKHTKTLRELWKEKITATLNNIKEKQKLYETLDELKFFDKHILKEELRKCCFIDLCTIDITYQYIMKSLYINFDEKLLDEFIDMLLFKNALMRLRKGYLAISGAGSQSEDYYFHKIVSEWTLDFINRKYKEKKSYCDKDEPTDEKSILADTAWWRNW